MNSFGACALATILLLAPFAPVINARHAAFNNINQQQQDADVPPQAEQTLFNKAQSLYTQGRYQQAAVLLQDFLKTYPQSSIADLTLLWLGRSYMELGRLPEAEQIGQRLRTIKDTPFAEIYETELQKARRDSARSAKPPAAVASPGLQSTTTLASSSTAAPSTTSGASQRSQNPIPVPTLNVGSPNSIASKNGNAKPSTGQQQQQARLITSASNASTTDSPTIARNEAAPVSTRRGREARRQPQTRVSDTPKTPNNQVAANSSPNGNRIVTPKTSMAGTQADGVNSSRPRAATNSTAANTVTAANTNAKPGTLSGKTPGASIAPNSAASSSGGASTGTGSAEPALPPQSGGLNLTVKQVPALALALRRATEAASPGQVVRLPLTITNTGNKEDQFRLDTDLPAEYQPTFSLAQGEGGTAGAIPDSGLPILVTQQLARGASTEVTLNLRVPGTAADGQQRHFIVRAASLANSQVMRISDGSINVVAAALAAASNVSQASVLPGGTFTQVITVRNSGSSPAKLTRTNFVFDPDFELVSANPAPTAYDPPSRTAIWLLGNLGPRESRDINVTLRAMPEALAASNSLGRGTVSTQSLPVGSNFDSPSIAIGKVARVRVDAVSIGLTATPGDATYIPFVVRNPGNSIDSYDLKLSAPGSPPATIYADTNSDGKHQDDEPAVTQTAPIEPQGGQYALLLRAQIPATAPDRQQYSYNVVARSLTSSRVASEANTVLSVATPRVRVRTEQVADVSAPGDAIFYRLVLVNEGSGLAKNLIVTETLPDALQFAGSEPGLNPQDAPGSAQRFQWRVAELAPGDTSVLRIAVRLRPNLKADTNLTTTHTLVYKDSNGNNYVGQ